MKLYSDASKTAPSPRRVRMFLAEKRIDVDVVEMALHKENRTGDFLKKNPMGTLPVLEMDDGVCISESIATIEMWNRRSELSFYLPIEFAGGFMGDQVADGARKRVEKMIWLFDRELYNRPFVAGAHFSVADITTYVAIEFGARFNSVAVPAKAENFRRWQADMAGRPSATA
jgi:glutathione S-transferase